MSREGPLPEMSVQDAIDRALAGVRAECDARDAEYAARVGYEQALLDAALDGRCSDCGTPIDTCGGEFTRCGRCLALCFRPLNLP